MLQEAVGRTTEMKEDACMVEDQNEGVETLCAITAQDDSDSGVASSEGSVDIE